MLVSAKMSVISGKMSVIEIYRQLRMSAYQVVVRITSSSPTNSGVGGDKRVYKDLCVSLCKPSIRSGGPLNSG